ncbi:hypothetical protein [Curtobacterium sp. MCPF17_052]|uniref:hypothetical protein n=1 Tax=Curtobacterium sp. MCPF17_052 TaxID=2175655 RepID=UPI000DAAC9FF|nr:hypothetical protein [Curtobacterium sp. MCPF17_052]WIB13718.1 hypothetical protein DEJ36_08555 [Curtobacterium sp. MCPF17_052]
MEVADERRARASARRAWLAVVVVGVVVVLATGAATAESLRAGADLTRSQADGAGVLQEQLRFSDVRTVLRETDLIKAAQAVGGAAQIDWSEVLGSVGAALPADTTITGLTVSSMDPLKGFGQSTVPLAQSRVATIDITISSPTVPSIPSLSDSLQQVPGYVGASITAVASADEGAAFTGQVSLELGPAAFDETYEYKAVD